MKFIGLSLITDNVSKLVKFYEMIFGVKSNGDQIHSTLHIYGLDLAIYSKNASIDDMKFIYRNDANYGYTTLMFLVENIDLEYNRLLNKNIEFITKPTLYPWGTKAFHFRDPDGNIIDFVEKISQ
jgi:uncharacterized glyoxalase superfamily protein PhnB